MFLPLPFVGSTPCHFAVAGTAFDMPKVIASIGAFNQGAPPGAPVS